MDQKVQDSIQELSTKYHYSWLDPIIQVNKDVQNPYFDEKRNSLNFDHSFLKNPIGSIYAQNENIISFNDVPITKLEKSAENNDSNLNQIQLSNFVTQTQPLSSTSQPNATIKFSSSFNVQPNLQTPHVPGFIIRKSIKICKIEHPTFDFIEPIMFSAFLYSRQTRSIISEVWNFYPDECSSFLNGFSPNLKNYQSATFLLDPTKNPDLMNYYLFIFASHPVKKDRGQAAVNYYLHPSNENAQKFQKVNAKCPDQQIPTFATFAFAFFEFKGISQKNESDPLGLQFFKIDKMPTEREISQLGTIVIVQKYEKLDLTIRMSKSDIESELLIRQLSARRPQPYMNPINQAVLHVDSLSIPQMDDSDSNNAPPIDSGYVVKIEFRDNNSPIEAIRSNYDPSKYVQNQMTKLCFPPTSSSFNESYVINLPYPINSSITINFTLYKCNYLNDKGKDKSKTPYSVDEVGSQSISFLDDFVDDHSKVLFPGERILAIHLSLISSAYTNNKNLYTFLSNPENPPFSLLQGVSSYYFVTYLFSILNVFVRKLIIYNDTDFVDEFVKVCDTILKDYNAKIKNNYNISTEDLSNFLLTFVRNYAFTPSLLNEIQNHPIIPISVQSNPEKSGNEETETNNKFIPNPDFANLQFHQKLFILLTNFLQTHENGIDIISPYLDFFFALITKYINLLKPQKSNFTDEFGIFILKFINCSSFSPNFSQLVCSYAVFANFLYDSGYSEVAVDAVKVLLMNWPENLNSTSENDKYIKAKNDFIEFLFKPSFFAMLIINSKQFQDIVIGLIKQGYDSIATSPEPSRLFDILFRLSEVFDDNMNQIICSKLVEATNFFQPNLFANKDSVLSPCIYFLYLLANCSEPPSSKKIFDGLHYLLTKISKQNSGNDTSRNSASTSSEASQKEAMQTEGKRRLKKTGTFSMKKKNSDVANVQNLNQTDLPILKDDKETKLFINYTNKSVFDLIIKLEKSNDAPIPCIISLIFHLIMVTKELEFLEQMIFILTYYMKKFKMKFINTTSPALVRIITKLFNLSLLSTKKKPSVSKFAHFQQADIVLPSPPSSSRSRARATSFAASKMNAMEGQSKIEPHEAPENTSFRNDSNNPVSINIGKMEYQKNQDIKLAAEHAAAQYQSATIQLPGFGPEKKKAIPPLELGNIKRTSSYDSGVVNDNYLIYDESITAEQVMNRLNNLIGEFINTMFIVDFECNKNNNRSSAIFLRALSSLKDDQITSENISNLITECTDGNNENKIPNDSLTECIGIYQQIRDITKQIIQTKNTSFLFEEQCELYYNLFRLYSKSPDAQVDVLEKLYGLHIKKGFPFEAASVSIVQASIIFENLTVWYQIPNYFRLTHPCLVFKENCGMCATVQCSDQYRSDPPLIPGFCDSFMFNEQGFFSLLYRALEDCSKNKVLKLASMLIDLCWPIFEYWKSFNELQVMFSRFNEIYSSLVEDAEDQDAFADRFFRVTFYGNKLKETDGKTYIYRQKPLTHLYDFTKNIISNYADIYGKENIVQISESGKVDTTKLDLVNKIYIQITFVEPYIRSKVKSGANNGITNNAMSVNLDDHFTQFFYDTPFVKNEDNKADTGKAHQATMDKQWIRKTILTTEFELPSVLIRSEVNPSSIVEKDMEPIKVVCKQIRDRTKQLEKAIESNDMMKTQQLLHGSLLVQVNEGPAKIADVFLGDETKSKSKAADKLRDAFIFFMRQLRKGVSVHAQLTAQNPEFQPLQDELEAGYESLKNKLAPLCIKPSIKASYSTQVLKTANQMSNLNLIITENSSSNSVVDSQANAGQTTSTENILVDNPNGNTE